MTTMKELLQIRKKAEDYLVKEFCNRGTDHFANVDVIYRYARAAYIRGYRDARKKYKRKLKAIENKV